MFIVSLSVPRIAGIPTASHTSCRAWAGEMYPPVSNRPPDRAPVVVFQLRMRVSYGLRPMLIGPSLAAS